jgi:hypothetical protein
MFAFLLFALCNVLFYISSHCQSCNSSRRGVICCLGDLIGGFVAIARAVLIEGLSAVGITL